jgi:hypothetical protein
LLPKNFDESANYALNVKFGDEFQPVIANLIAPKSAIVIAALSMPGVAAAVLASTEFGRRVIRAVAVFTAE